MFLDLDEDEAYAGTSYSEWQKIAKQMENFKWLQISDIEPENRMCDICYEPLGRSNAGRPSEEPIQLLSCGHVFGHICLFNWLATLMPNGKWTSWSDVHPADQGEEAQQVRDDPPTWLSEDLTRASDPPTPVSCPKCRATFPIHRYGKSGLKIQLRLDFWDALYRTLGLARSPAQEHARTILLRYMQMVHEPALAATREHIRTFTLQARASAVRFALRPRHRLTQPRLRSAIFHLGCFGLPEREYRASAYENRPVPLWCHHVGVGDPDDDDEQADDGERYSLASAWMWARFR